MKNVLPIVLFLTLFLINQTTVKLGLLPEALTWTLEAVILGITIIILARLITRKTINISLNYLILFSCFFYVIISGVILNDVSALTVVAGIRTYLKYIPIFLLPFAFNYSIDDLKKQFMVLIVLGFIQAPISLWQRFFLYQHTESGDAISGTLNSSNSVSIFAISMIIILTALYFRKIVSLKIFIISSILLFIPATLNETKVTPILLTIGIISLLFLLRKELTLKHFVTISLSGLSFLITFVFIYNTLYIDDPEHSFSDRMSKEHLIDNYAYKKYQVNPRTILDLKHSVVGATRELPTIQMGRVDSITIPLNVLFNGGDIGKLFFGLGIGNVNSSRSNANYTYINSLGGAYTALALLLWETGIAGTFIFVLIMISIARDSIALTKNKGTWGAFAAAWTGITLIFIATLVYNNIFHNNELACLFVYFSGMIVAKRYLKRQPQLKNQQV